MQDSAERHKGKEKSTGKVTVLIRHHAIIKTYSGIEVELHTHTHLTLGLDENEW
jgi:hypothetical protein